MQDAEQEYDDQVASCKAGSEATRRPSFADGRPNAMDQAITDSISLTLGVPTDDTRVQLETEAYTSHNVQAISTVIKSKGRSSAHRSSVFASRMTSALTPAPESFFDVFGVLGVPMIAAFVMSAAALVNQAYIQIYPAEYVNLVMNTTTLDSGDFWMMPQPETVNMTVSVVILLFFAGCYLALILYAVFFRHRALAHQTNSTTVMHGPDAVTRKMQQNEPQDGQAAAAQAFADPSDAGGSFLGRLQLKGKQAHEIYMQFSSLDGIYNKYYSLVYDAPKLSYLMYTLVKYLQKGFPLPLTIFYAVMLMLYWSISFFRFQRSTIDRFAVLERQFYLLDIFFVVFAPMIVLIYAYYNFNLDRAVFAIRQEVLPASSFDRIARLFANPAEQAVFLVGFRSMLLSTSSLIVIKTILLWISIYKWRKIITTVVQSTHAKRQDIVMPKKRQQSRRHLCLGFVIYMVFGVSVVLHVVSSIAVTSKNCAPYANCVVASNQWYVKSGACPCLVYSNRNDMPATWDLWMNPPNATEELSVLAEPGTLTTIYITNQALPTLPDALQHCTHLKQLTLIYSKIEVIPDWAKKLTVLEYFHIEGDFSGREIKYIPNDVFSEMKSLKLIHLGIILTLTSVPSLAGLTKLQYFALGAPHMLAELPPMDDLKSLLTLSLSEAYHLTQLPSLEKLKKLRYFSVTRRSEMCCNGFLSNGVCDLTDYRCKPHVNETTVVCRNNSIPASEMAWIKAHTTGSICAKVPYDLVDVAPSYASTDGACGGVMFRKCTYRNTSGICFNTRMQVINCDTTGQYESIRRLEIARNVGVPCDPSVEAWLGCTS